MCFLRDVTACCDSWFMAFSFFHSRKRVVMSCAAWPGRLRPFQGSILSVFIYTLIIPGIVT